jgi:hypothetical protein
MGEKNIDHNAEFERTINHFSGRIDTLAKRQLETDRKALTSVWPLARLLAEIKAFTPSTQVLGRLRKERFPTVSSGDFSRYVFIGQNMEAVQSWHKAHAANVTSAQRIASGYKKWVKDEAARKEAIEAYKQDAGKVSQIATGGEADYLKRLKAGIKKAPTVADTTYNGRVHIAFNSLYTAVDELLKLNKEKPLPAAIVKAINDEFDSVIEATTIETADEKAA